MTRPGIGHFYSILKLEIKLQCKLRQTRIFDLRHLTKLRTICAVTVWVIELRVVEKIEQLRSKFEVRTLVDRNILNKRDIRVADSRPAADRARSAANITKHICLTKNRSLAGGAIEIVITIGLWPLPGKGGDLIRFAG